MSDKGWSAEPRSRYGIFWDVTDANGHLIAGALSKEQALKVAAAPDLLAELKWAMDTLQDFGVTRNTADQAIAKAEGWS